MDGFFHSQMHVSLDAMPVDPGNASRALDGGIFCERRRGQRPWMALSTAK